MNSALDIRFVGTGGAFEVELGNSAAVVTLHGKNYLIDCGHSVFPRLVKLGIADQIDGVFVTHLHDDHVGSLSSFVLYYSLVLQKGRLKIYVPSDRFRNQLTAFLAHSLGDPKSRIDFRSVDEVAGAGFIDTFGKHVEWMQTYAFHFTDGQKSIVYSGDNGDVDFLMERVLALKLPDAVIFHEVFFHFEIAAHSFYRNVMRWSEAGHKIYGYHCDPQHAPADNTLPLVIQFPEYLF
jgi:ribonuclease BN (tRNA processing enzyme)